MTTSASRIAALAGVSIADLDGSLLAALGLRNADVTGEVLLKAGIALADLPVAIDATRRCLETGAWSWSISEADRATRAAEFVATAAAIGGLTGPQLLLVPNLARLVAR